MDSVIFNSISWLQSYNVDLPIVLWFGALGCLFLATFMGMTLSHFLKLPDELGVILSLSACLVIGVVVGLKVINTTKDSAHFKVGMCFERKTNVDKENVAGYLRYRKSEVERLSKALTRALEMKVSNVLTLEEELSQAKKIVAEYEVEMKMPEVLEFVVIEQGPNSHLTYERKMNKLDSNFSLENDTYQVACKPELKAMVDNYKMTGKIVASK